MFCENCYRPASEASNAPGIGLICVCGCDGFVGPIAVRKLVALKRLVHLTVKLRDSMMGFCPVCHELTCEPDCPNGDVREFLHDIGLPVKAGGYTEQEVAEHLNSYRFDYALMGRG